MVFSWNVCKGGGQLWGQRFNIILVNNPDLLRATFISKIVSLKPDNKTDNVPPGTRLYQWPHLTGRLDGWLYPPSGFIMGGGGTINPVNGEKK